ncbi:MAG TPA: DivIVA domain-containing protein [Catenuloplanes sp.]
MPRQIVIEFPDDVPDRLYADVVATMSTMAGTIANAASPPLRLSLHHEGGSIHHDGDPVEHPDRPAHPDGGSVAEGGPWWNPVAPRHLPAGLRDAPGGFTVVLRGYDRGQVETWISQVRASAPPYPRPDFDVVLRGYDRGQVDELVRQVCGTR